MKVRVCEKCNAVTELRKCLICGKATVKMEKSEIKFLVKGKETPSSKVPRFPRLPDQTMKDQKEIIEKIEQTCETFDAPGRVTAVKPGPIVTSYTFQPKSHVRLKRIRGMYEDIAMALGRDNCSIIRVAGESAVAIMVPNRERKVPSFTDLLPGYLKFRKEMALPLNMGVDSLGTPIVLDLAKLPHLLVAGETGSGKSNFLNVLITSMLWGKSPKQVKLMLIDSKQVELSGYKDIPHVDGEPAMSIWEAMQLLTRAEEEMRHRLNVLKFKNCKNLKELNEKVEPQERLPYIVIVMDEIADLVLQKKKEFTNQLAIIAGMARAAGVHIIAATQRPAVDVLNGKIKVNFPARVAFHVPAPGDSKTILMTKGAEQLMGKGDAFAILPDRPGLTRLHTPLIEEKDIRRVLRASLAAGHHLRVPADLTEKELDRMEQELAATEKAKAAIDAKSLADMAEETAKEAPKVQSSDQIGGRSSDNPRRRRVN